MADDTAHTAPGPESDQSGVDPAVTDEAQDEAGVTVAAAPPWGIAERVDAVDSDVDVVGRNSIPAPAVEEAAPEPVLVGAGPGVAAHGGGPTPAALPPAVRAGQSTADGDDLPVWSFREAIVHRDPGTGTDRNQAELPLALDAQRAAQPERNLPHFGPVGTPRPALLVPLLAALTLGLYALVWHHRVNRELEEFDPKLHARPARSALAVTVPWLIGLLATVAGAVLIVSARLSVHVPFDSHVTTLQAYLLLGGLLAVPYLTLLVPFSVVSVVMTLERLRCVEEHAGSTTDRQVRPVGTSMLLAIPVVGGLVLLATAQRRINEVWDSVAPARRTSS